MGDETDYLYEQGIDEMVASDMYEMGYIPDDSGNFIGDIKYWQMGDGRVIAIAEMTDTHLKNTINFIKRKLCGDISDDKWHEYIDAMEHESDRRKSKGTKVTDNSYTKEPEHHTVIDVPFNIGDSVWVWESGRNACGTYQEEVGRDHDGAMMMTRTRFEYYEKAVNVKFKYGLLDEYKVDEIYKTKLECERSNKKMDKITNVDLKVVGVTFPNPDGSNRREIIRELANKQPEEIKIELVREPENAYDINAIKVLANDQQIGYIGKEYATIMAPIMDMAGEFHTVVKGIGEYKNRPYCEVTINEL